MDGVVALSSSIDFAHGVTLKSGKDPETSVEWHAKMATGESQTYVDSMLSVLEDTALAKKLGLLR